MIYLRSALVKDYSVDGFALDCLETLERNGIPYRLHGGSFIDAARIPKRLIPFQKNVGMPSPSEFQLVINPACFLKDYGINNHTIIYTVWDSTFMNPAYAFEINKARLVMVPSQATKECLENSGVEIDIEVVPHGYHSNFYRLNNNPIHGPCIFGSGGQVTSQKNDKKNLNKILEAFRLAFPGQNDVRLYFKTSPLSHFPRSFTDSRIKVTCEEIERDQMANWYRGLTCFINASKYEAFGQMMVESMACGTPIISSNVSGMKEYFDPESCMKIGYDIVPTRNETYPEGDWFDIKQDELVSLMRYVYHNRNLVYEMGQLASTRIQKFSYYKFEEKFLNVIRRFAY